MENGIRFEEVIETAVAWDFEFRSNTEPRACRFGELNGGENSVSVAVEVESPLV